MPSHRYNIKKYNQSHYNNDGTSYLLSLLESLSSSDVLMKSTIKELAETLTSSDVKGFADVKPLTESLLLLDALTRQITNKALSDRLRLHDWLELRKNPQSDPWGD